MQWKPFGEKSYNFLHTPVRQQARINILHGAVRSAKTCSLVWKILELIHSGPKGLGIITGVTKNTIQDNVLIDLFSTIGRKNYDYNRSTGDLFLFGDRWKVMGAKDEGSYKYLLGKTIAKAICDEGTIIPESFFVQLLNRMSVKDARLYLTTNPGPPSHYLYTNFITDKEKLDSGMVWAQHYELDDNPNLDEEYKNFIKKAYTGVFYQRYILGLWVVAEGVIYRDCWSDDLLFDDDSCPPGLYNNYAQRVISIDYGTTNPCVFGDWRDDGDIVWMINDYYYDSKKQMHQKTDGEYADDLEVFIGPKKDAIVIIDPSAASFKAELFKRGIMVRDADNDVENGIRRTASAMAQKKIRVHKKCTDWIREVKEYAWDVKKGEKGEDVPLKTSDHHMDQTRYFVNTIFGDWRLNV